MRLHFEAISEVKEKRKEEKKRNYRKRKKDRIIVRLMFVTDVFLMCEREEKRGEREKEEREKERKGCNSMLVETT